MSIVYIGEGGIKAVMYSRLRQTGDLFVTHRIGDGWTQWTKPKNMGPIINSDRWDAYFSLPASGELAYLVSSENSHGKGDIFCVELPKGSRPEPMVVLKGFVYDERDNSPLKAVL